jgi:hypothetical protein
MWAELEEAENADILTELNDEKYKGRTHATRSTYAKGCRGPLCRKSERDRGRERHASRQAEKGKEVTRLPATEAQGRDEYLDRVIAWHRLVRSEPVSA